MALTRRLVDGDSTGTDRATFVPRVPRGLCECGCGMTTPNAPVTSRKRGWTKGEPIRFVRGHSMRVTNRYRRGVERVETIETDHGFWSACLIWTDASKATRQ